MEWINKSSINIYAWYNAGIGRKEREGGGGGNGDGPRFEVIATWRRTRASLPANSVAEVFNARSERLFIERSRGFSFFFSFLFFVPRSRVAWKDRWISLLMRVIRRLICIGSRACSPTTEIVNLNSPTLGPLSHCGGGLITVLLDHRILHVRYTDLGGVSISFVPLTESVACRPAGFVKFLLKLTEWTNIQRHPQKFHRSSIDVKCKG